MTAALSSISSTTNATTPQKKKQAERIFLKFPLQIKYVFEKTGCLI
jgi:hypothetical protein